jgi:uncharacterized membrane protein YfcA
MHLPSAAIVSAAFFAAGIINAIAGGGSFLTLPALLLAGLDPRAANITSTIALFPMQVSAGYAGRKLAGGTEKLPLKALFAISLAGGTLGAFLLLLTPPVVFARLIPWLILFATLVFAYSSFFKKPGGLDAARSLGAASSVLIQFGISIYGGYFGGGIGFLMLAALALAGMDIRKAGTTKNILAAVMNAAAVVIFLFSRDISWPAAAIGAAASILGGLVGVRLLKYVDERKLRVAVVAIGSLLTVAMFIYAPS